MASGEGEVRSEDKGAGGDFLRVDQVQALSKSVHGSRDHPRQRSEMDMTLSDEHVAIDSGST